jgi:hypothetical protein
LLPVLDSLGIQGAANEMITHARQVFDPASPDEDDRMFLKVVPDSRNIGRDFDIVGQADPGDFPESGVGLLGRGREHARANASLLRAILQRRRLTLVVLLRPAFSH